jgi:hypothetical protein
MARARKSEKEAMQIARVLPAAAPGCEGGPAARRASVDVNFWAAPTAYGVVQRLRLAFRWLLKRA